LTVTPTETPTVTVTPTETPTLTVTPTETPTPAGTPTAPFPTPAGVDHYKLYDAFGPDAPTVTIADQFGVMPDVDLGEVFYLLNPVAKSCPSCEPPIVVEPAQHLVGYEILDVAPPLGVSIVNQFGPQEIVVRDPAFLAVPSEKTETTLPPTPVPLTIDHYKCYQADGPAIGLAVSLTDQFGTAPAMVGPVVFFCNPADKNGEGIVNLDGHLTCYEIDHSFTPLEVTIRNQFHETPIDVDLPFALCVPSLKLGFDPLPTPTSTPSGPG
jgi:hypothetical protein